MRSRGKVIIGKGVLINSSYKVNPIGGQCFTSIYVSKGAKLVIDDGVGISNTAIYCSESIKIGKRVYIGGDCKIYDTDFHSISLTDRMSKPESNIKKRPVVINNGAFIGTGTIVLKGVTIGEESVIAAGSVVTKDVPSHEVWGGNPAIFLKKIPQK